MNTEQLAEKLVLWTRESVKANGCRGVVFGVDIMPLGNLVKAQVRELVRFLGVPQQIID